MSASPTKSRDAGLEAAVAVAGGVRPLARLLGSPVSTVSGWVRVPRSRLAAVAAAVGLDPDEVRPDLAEARAAEHARAAIARARLVYGTDGAVVRFKGAREAASDSGVPVKVMLWFDFALVLTALKFAAEQFGLATRDLLAEEFGSGGSPSPAQRARAYGLALAVTALRIEPTAAAGLVGTTKQNVQNAARRYLDARDGKDVSAGPPGDRAALWAAEQRFLESVAR